MNSDIIESLVFIELFVIVVLLITLYYFHPVIIQAWRDEQERKEVDKLTGLIRKHKDAVSEVFAEANEEMGR